MVTHFVRKAVPFHIDHGLAHARIGKHMFYIPVPVILQMAEMLQRELHRWQHEEHVVLPFPKGRKRKKQG
jgi:hypothetical protein